MARAAKKRRPPKSNNDDYDEFEVDEMLQDQGSQRRPNRRSNQCLEPATVELVDDETGAVEWRGTLSEFFAENDDLDQAYVINELEHHGQARFGGGAVPAMTLREFHARASNAKRRKTNVDTIDYEQAVALLRSDPDAEVRQQVPYGGGMVGFSYSRVYLKGDSLVDEFDQRIPCNAIFVVSPPISAAVKKKSDALLAGRGRRANQTTKTPGYNKRLQIAFTTDKCGRPVAYYDGRPNSMRWFRLPYDEAKMHVAQGHADEVPFRPYGRASNPDIEVASRLARGRSR